MSENNNDIEEVGKQFKEFKKKHELLKQELEKNKESTDKKEIVASLPLTQPQPYGMPFAPPQSFMPPQGFPPPVAGLPPELRNTPFGYGPGPVPYYPPVIPQTPVVTTRTPAPQKSKKLYKNDYQNEIKTIKEFMQTLDSLKAFMQKFLDQETCMVNIQQTDDGALKEYTELRFLARSEYWPDAMDESEIVHENEEEKLHQAASILSTLVKSDLADKKVLHFGCKEGQTGYVGSTLFDTKLFVCYDDHHDKWKSYSGENLIYTESWSEVQKHRPYDVIIVNDMIDHTQFFEESLRKMAAVKSSSGKIFVRCHPWASRHGCHLHKDLNKAFLHLVFSEDELYGMGLKPLLTTPLLDPITSYRKMFAASGLSITDERITTREVELFFVHNTAINRRIREKWANSSNYEYANGSKFPREYMEIEFVDFTLI